MAIRYTYNPDALFNKSGVKRIDKKIDGSEIVIFALEKLSEGDRVVGYTDLKSHSSDKFNILTVKSETKFYDFNVLQRKHKEIYHKTSAYIPVGTAGNEYIAVVRVNPLPIMLLLLCLLGILLCFNFCDTHSNNKKPWKPTIQDFSNQWKEEDTTKSKSYIDVIGFTAASVDKDTGIAKVSLKNPEGNPCYFKFYIYTESGVPLYESDLVPPGKEITKIVLNKIFEKGTHKAYVFIETYELDTGERMNSAKFDIDIIFK